MTDWRKNIEVVLRSTLINNANVKAKVGVRSFIGDLATLSSPAFPLVTFKVISSEGFLAYYRGIIRIWAWAATLADASDVFGVVEVALNHVLVNDATTSLNLVLDSDLSTDTVFDPEIKMYARSGTFRFRATQL